MRKLVRETAKDRRVLNAFAYTGAFGVYALEGGAAGADNVETSEKALGLAGENLELNGFGEENGRLIAADVFDYLRNPEGVYDYIILDPPAFAKRKADVVNACRGYKDINRLAIKQVAPGGLVLTCSCSHHVDERLFRQVVFQAAAEAGRQVRVIQTHRQGFDHPVNIYHPETEYLKGLLLYVD
jgi:23S rRNA (cytosine1962-C5)-methyltransferase